MKSNPQIDKNGNKLWCLNNKFHRRGGPAIEYLNGDKFWCINGVTHRHDGAAVVSNSNHAESWHINGKIHRANGPAVIWHDNTKEYWLNGERFTKKQYDKFLIRQQPLV